MTDFLKIAKDYAVGVLNGNILVSAHVRLAVERSRADHERTDWHYRFDEAKAVAPCIFISKLKFVSDSISTKAGEPFVLRPDQIWFITELFGWVWKEGGGRRFRKAYLEIPRGNGKSCLASVISLYIICTASGGAQVMTAASLKPQARIVLDCAREIALKDKVLRTAYGLEVTANEIRQRASLNTMKALPAVATSVEGTSVSFAVLDELHAVRGRKLYDALGTGTSKRSQSLFLCVTTAGDSDAGIAWEVHEYSERVLKGIASDDSFLTILHGADPGDDWRSPLTWQKSNPGWGISVDPRLIEAAVQSAMQVPGQRDTFRSRHLNAWVRHDDEKPFLDERKINSCFDAQLTEEEFLGDACELAFDGASRLDLSAICRLHTKVIDKKMHAYAFFKSWLPENTILESRIAAYPKWVETGEIISTPGTSTDQDVIEEYIMTVIERFKVRGFSFDPVQSLMLMTHVAKRSYRNDLLIEVGQTPRNLTSGMLLLEELVADHRLHTNSTLLLWCLKNLRCKFMGSTLRMPLRPTERALKIDLAVALIMCLCRISAKPLDDVPQLPRIFSIDNNTGEWVQYGVETQQEGDQR